MSELDLASRALTARNLEDFATCPLKLMFSLTASREELEKLLGGPAMLTRAIRSALQDTLAGKSPGAVGSPSAPLPLSRDGTDTPQLGEQCWDGAALVTVFEAHFEGRYCADSREEDELRETGRQVLVSYARRVTDEEDRGTRAEAGDLQFEGEISGQRFRAAADLMLVSDGRRDLVRCSMSRQLPTPEELGKDPNVLLLHELASQRYNEGEMRIVVEALRHEARVSPDFGDGRREEGLAELVRAAGGLRRAREFPPAKGEHCRWCRSRRRCPAWRR